MKKLNKLTAVLLSLALCLGMVAPAFAASLDDLQDAINGGSGDTEENKIDDGYYGYGENANNTEGNGWDIWAKDNDDGGRDIELKGDVTHEETDKTDTIIVDDKVNIDLNDNNITGDGEHTVIKVEEGGDLTIENGTISNNPSNAETPAEGANGIDVEGDLTLDGVTIKDTDTAVNVEEGGTAEIEGSTITDNNTGVAFEDSDSVTFIGDQNLVNNNKKDIDGSGRVNFTLTDEDGKETTYKVDAETAETLLADKDKIAAHGTDWILTKNDGDAYTVVYTGHGGPANWQTTLTPKIVTDVLKAAGAGGKAISGFVVSGDVTEIGASAFKNCTLEQDRVVIEYARDPVRGVGYAGQAVRIQA